jgi:hypothetical protein
MLILTPKQLEIAQSLPYDVFIYLDIKPTPTQPRATDESLPLLPKCEFEISDTQFGILLILLKNFAYGRTMLTGLKRVIINCNSFCSEEMFDQNIEMMAVNRLVKIEAGFVLPGDNVLIPEFRVDFPFFQTVAINSHKARLFQANWEDHRAKNSRYDASVAGPSSKSLRTLEPIEATDDNSQTAVRIWR